jgi:predicted O-methyltransferase YrrM
MAFYRHETCLEEFVPRGHFHSPLPDIEQAIAYARTSDRETIRGIPGIDMRDDLQRSIFAQMQSLASDFDWPQQARAGRRYYREQNWFGTPDAFVLYAMLRLLKPSTIVEIGSGFSSALMLDVAERHGLHIDFTFIDPRPSRLRSLLKPSDQSQAAIHAKPVQDIPLSLFQKLGADDILFVDSSHVSRTGGDLNHIVFSVLPALAPGVVLHFHDVFWPFEYPAAWLQKGLAWNEAYLLRAFLMFNNDFEMLFWAPYAAAICPELSEGLARF